MPHHHWSGGISLADIPPEKYSAAEYPSLCRRTLKANQGAPHPRWCRMDCHCRPASKSEKTLVVRLPARINSGVSASLKKSLTAMRKASESVGNGLEAFTLGPLLRLDWLRIHLDC
jgi:hypothetical protein